MRRLMAGMLALVAVAGAVLGGVNLRRRYNRWGASLGEAQTRFIIRNRITLKDAPFAARAAMVVVDPGASVMEHKMLLGIKERAEKLYSENPGEEARPPPHVAA